MSEWWTYRLSDFLLFAPRTYWRQFELMNLQWWPLQPLLLAAGVLIALMGLQIALLGLVFTAYSIGRSLRERVRLAAAAVRVSWREPPSV